MRKTAVSAVVMLMGALALAGCSHEAADWKAASGADTGEAYQQFLKQYPRSANAAQAQTRLTQLAEDRDWQSAAAADTRTAYEQFVAQHPQSKWAQEARIRIENFAQSASAAAPGLTADAGAASPPASVAAPSEAPASSASSKSPSPPKTAGTSNAHHAKLAARSAHSAPHASRRVAQVGSREQLVQLGAYRSRARAESEWKLLRAHYPAQLKSAHPLYVAVHGRTGQLYRLQVKLSSAADAKGLCATLKHHAQPCVRVSA